MEAQVASRRLSLVLRMAVSCSRCAGPVTTVILALPARHPEKQGILLSASMHSGFHGAPPPHACSLLALR